MLAPYHKPWLSYPDQVDRLKKRGLVVQDASKAATFLSHLNYYRFSGYCLAFESARHVFIPGTTFDDIVAAYEFDLALRDLITEALEVVEVDVRAAIAYSFGEKHGAFGHISATNFHRSFNHSDWLKRLRKEASRSSEMFITHFKQTYQEFPDLPVWVVTETMAFGSLSIMFKNMNRPDQMPVVSRYGLQPAVFASWMHHAVYVRNLCAHHSRLWDRNWAIKPNQPQGRDWATVRNTRLHVTLLLLRYLLKRIPPVAPLASEWQRRVEAHLATPPNTPKPLDKMGLPTGWQNSRIWR
jgi:abortive infection bacteriophage resistance protein